jgi:hypothetical protein
MAHDIKDILNSIQELNKKSSQEIYIPSLRKGVMFNPLTAKDQKVLLESSIDNILYQSKYYVETYNLIKRLAHEDIVGTITTFDRDFILLGLRVKFLDKLYTYKENEEDITVDLSSLLDITDEYLPTVENIPEGDIIVKCSNCSLMREYDLYTQISKTHVNINPKDTEELREIVGNVYIYEIYKYIDSIFIDLGGDELTIDFNSSQYSLTQKIDILLTLDRKLIKKIMEYINNLKNYQNKWFTVDGYTVNIDTELFSI